MSTPAHDEDTIIYTSPRTYGGPDDDLAFYNASSDRVVPVHEKVRAMWDHTTLNRLPTAAAAREEHPIQTGCIDYFPDAVAEIAKLSFDATKQHHPSEEMHWQRDKSTAHADKIQRHQIERFDKDSDGHYHATKVAWRALAQLQELLEETRGLPPSRASQGKRRWDP
jgi:hypothetical protein